MPNHEPMKDILARADFESEDRPDKPSIEELIEEEIEASTLHKPQHPGPAYGAATLLEAAKAMEDRQAVYGPPLDNFERIATRWRAHLSNRFGISTAELPLTAQDVSVMMIDVKLARLEQTPDHDDSWVDVAGYAGCGAHIAAIGRGDVEGE